MKLSEHATRLIEATTYNVKMGGGPFGALIILPTGKTITAFNSVTQTHDPTAHAEVNAIREAGIHLGTHDLTGATMVATGEPCPMCFTACLWARLDHVYFINTLDQAAKAGFDDTEFYEQIRGEGGPDRIGYDHLPHPRANDPYQAWENNPDRIEY